MLLAADAALPYIHFLARICVDWMAICANDAGIDAAEEERGASTRARARARGPIGTGVGARHFRIPRWVKVW